MNDQENYTMIYFTFLILYLVNQSNFTDYSSTLDLYLSSQSSRTSSFCGTCFVERIKVYLGPTKFQTRDLLETLGSGVENY